MKCWSQVDSSGLHGLSCTGSSGRHPRHNALNSIISRALATTGFPSILKPPAWPLNSGQMVNVLMGSPLSSGRRGVPWCGIPHVRTLMRLPTLLWLFVKYAGLVAKQAEDSKKQKYGDMCSAYTFVPSNCGGNLRSLWGCMRPRPFRTTRVFV